MRDLMLEVRGYRIISTLLHVSFNSSSVATLQDLQRNHVRFGSGG